MAASRLKAARLALRRHANPKKAVGLQRFFKTGPGEYAEGDVFIGVMVPQTRQVAREFQDLKPAELRSLLRSEIHEERLLALVILVLQFRDPKRRENIYRFYLSHTRYINNWDLVDVTAPQIVGGYLEKRSRAILHRFSRSKQLWERRIAIVSTQHFIRLKDFNDTLAICKTLLGDNHDLIHKACGWMLREVGKRNVAVLEGFLDTYAARMPRTMLRYAIERLPPARRKHYMLAR